MACSHRLPSTRIRTRDCKRLQRDMCEEESSPQASSTSRDYSSIPCLHYPRDRLPLPNVEDIDAILEPAVGKVGRVCLSPAGQGNILGDIDCTVVGGHHNDGGPCGNYQSRKVSSAHDWNSRVPSTPHPGSVLYNNGPSCYRALRTQIGMCDKNPSCSRGDTPLPCFTRNDR